jgi:Cytochrome P460
MQQEFTVHRSLVFAGMVCLAAGCAAVLLRPAKIARAASVNGPVYLASGEMVAPENYREWIYLSSGVDMSYTEKPANMTMFDNVFVNPEAYRSFLATGIWPDKTMMVLEVREARDKGSINLHGHFQGQDVMGLEVHVKDEKRFPGKWAFFDFDKPTSNGTLIPSGASCYTCHAAHGAVDTTFAQFYPTLLPVAKDKGTLSAEFLKDEAAHAAPAAK